MAAPLTRVGLRLAERTVDVAVPHGVPVYEALRAAGVALDDPALAVVDSAARVVDVYAVTGDQLPDGAVLHLVTSRRGAAPVRPTERRVEVRRDPAAARPTASPWWLAVAGAAAVVLAAVVGLEVLDRAPQPSVRPLLVAVALGAALLLAAAPARPGAFGSTWPTVVAVLVAGAAGVATVQPAASASGRLAVVAGLCGATAAAAVRWAVARRRRDEAAELAVVLLVALGAAAAVTALVLAAELPGVLAAGALLGAVPLALRVLPSLSVDVPDEQLLDITPVARTVSLVRAPEPVPLGRVNLRMVTKAVDAAERRRDAGATVLAALAVVCAPVLLASAGESALARWAGVAAVLLVAVVLALQPRTVRPAAVRWTQRGAAVLLVLELALAGGLASAAGTAGADVGTLLLVAAGVTVLGLLVVWLSLPLGRGWRSVGFSRSADALEGLATVLALPVALLGAGAVEALRTLTS
ncbi:hypothetical protein GXB85_02050 [Cellulomonas sp. APG4]|uniref:hypothetical protein n=1 Tax=Cellulomonas sp. APG4 TaxID=1538656 RepID=UPI00137B5E93|nr:hypothetical protein [Cellulomonas sp. APG4]NCT89739.1 hypothetical protein [Cellulomonas sp. APG4]